MSTDAMTAMVNDYSDDVYKQLMDDAAKDDAVGKHRAIVLKNELGKWPSGDDRYKIQFSLLTAGNVKADLTWSEPPSKEQLAELMPTLEKKAKRAISANITHAQQLAQHYGKTVPQVREGEEYFVQTIRTRRDPKDNSGGFVRIVAFLPKDGAAAAGGNSGGPGF